jgi:predicted nucleic acid-binding protein
LVKLYADEPASEVVRSLTIMTVSGLARVEVPSAIWRKHREGELLRESAYTFIALFETDWFGAEDSDPRFMIVEPSSPLLDNAAPLTRIHGLRAYDAVQLATAIAARTADPDIDSFACFDEALRSGAGAEGFDVVPA